MLEYSSPNTIWLAGGTCTSAEPSHEVTSGVSVQISCGDDPTIITTRIALPSGMAIDVDTEKSEAVIGVVGVSMACGSEGGVADSAHGDLASALDARRGTTPW
jgi:hypothetical protein